MDNKSLIRCFGVNYLRIFARCLYFDEPKNSTIGKNIRRYFTAKHLIRYMYSILLNNLVLRVVRHLGQRGVARKDSGVLKSLLFFSTRLMDPSIAFSKRVYGWVTGCSASDCNSGVFNLGIFVNCKPIDFLNCLIIPNKHRILLVGLNEHVILHQIADSSVERKPETSLRVTNKTPRNI